MSVEGLDSLITKFKDLWKTGSHAKLTVTTHAGKAWFNLNVGLGRFQTLFFKEEKSTFSVLLIMCINKQTN